MDPKELSLITTVIVLIIIIILVMSILIVMILQFFKREKEKHKYEIELLSIESQKVMLNTQLEIQEQTFQQISREIHDHIGQRLTLARLYLNGLSDAVSKEQINVLSESSALIGEAIGDLKQLSRTLTANLIRDEGLIQSLKIEIDRISKITGLSINLSCNDELPFLSVEKELILFRIAQEALQNIIKHAEASKVDILINYKDGNLSLIIKDNGKGFDILTVNSDPNLKKSGLENLKKRADLLHGDLEIRSSIGIGTSLNFCFPYIIKI